MNNDPVTIPVYVAIKDIYKKLACEISIMNDNEISQWFNSLKNKEQQRLCTLLLNDLDSQDVLITNGMIRETSSRLISFLKDKGLSQQQAYGFWWFMYDSLKDIGQMKIDYQISSAKIIGGATILNMRPQIDIPKKALK